MTKPWSPLDLPSSPASTLEPSRLAHAAASIYATAAGQELFDHLAELTLAQPVSPDRTDAALWHAEGRRSVVLYLRNLIAQGRQS